MIRSTAGSSARFRNTTALSSAPVFSKSSMKYCASSLVMPIAANTTAKASSEPGTFACLAICRAISLCGRPEPEKIGSFWPLTSVLVPSIVEIPVWMNSSGGILEYGFIEAPFTSILSSGTMRGPPSRGSPEPERIRPSMSFETGSLMVSPVNTTPDSSLSPPVPSKTCTATMSADVSST